MHLVSVSVPVPVHVPGVGLLVIQIGVLKIVFSLLKGQYVQEHDEIGPGEKLNTHDMIPLVLRTVNVKNVSLAPDRVMSGIARPELKYPRASFDDAKVLDAPLHTCHEFTIPRRKENVFGIRKRVHYSSDKQAFLTQHSDK